MDRLPRTKQCAMCPWKVSTDPYTIPNGYSVEKHAALRDTIARPGALNLGGPLRMMACHKHPVGKEVPCVGWVANQIGPGNNLGLRLSMMRCENLHELELDGPQHQRFEDTLPKSGGPATPAGKRRR